MEGRVLRTGACSCKTEETDDGTGRQEGCRLKFASGSIIAQGHECRDSRVIQRVATACISCCVGTAVPAGLRSIHGLASTAQCTA